MNCITSHISQRRSPSRCAIRQLVLTVLFTASVQAQSDADSVTLTVRRYAGFPTVHWTGQFNGWQPTAWPMQYQGDHWAITRTFRIHDAADTQRNLGDSVYQYKFTTGATGSTVWTPDPLNPEQNALDNNNSILRLSALFWFQYYQFESGSEITGIAATLGHANADSISSVRLTTAETNAGPFTTVDITGGFNRSTRVLTHTLSQPIPKSSYVRLVGLNQRGDSVVYAKGGYVVQSMEMPSYAELGVTLPGPHSGDSTSFRISVSGKDVILLHISPAGDSPATSPGIALRRSVSQPNDWWTNLALAPGVYEYQYEVEGSKLILDPWGREVGQFGTRFTVGPAGLTADDYVWTSTEYERPSMDELVIYELHVGEFAGGYNGKADPQNSGTFLELARLMGHFDSLGINAIELMPVNDFGPVGRSGHSWGYDLNSYFALEPSYGTPREFKALVDSAHAHGIAVVVDVVFNHLNETSALWQMQPDATVNPYFKENNDLRFNEDALFFFRDIDHWTSETQSLVLAALRMWLDEYRVDGFRYDFTQGIGWNINDPTKGILGWANAIGQIYNNEVYQIAEHLPESPSLISRSDLTSGWHDSFRDEIFNEARFRNVSLYSLRNLALRLGAYGGNDTPSTPASYGNRTEAVNATVTHDEQSLIYEMNVYQGIPFDDAVKRDKLYGTLMFASLGIPMLWEGMELGESRGFSEGNKLSYRPVDAALRMTSRGQSHFRYYQSLIHHRRYNPALTNGRMIDLAVITDGGREVLVWGLKDSTSGSSVVVVGNFGASEASVTNVPWISPGTWYDIHDQSSTLVLSDSTVPQFNIPAYTAVIYANMTNEGLGILTSMRQAREEIPNEWTVHQNYPNPFNPQTSISFYLSSRSHVSAYIYDILGRKIDQLIDGVLEGGTHTLPWNAARHAGGVYVCRITTSSGSRAIKMILNK